MSAEASFEQAPRVSLQVCLVAVVAAGVVARTREWEKTVLCLCAWVR
jgi:hypothetical protein